MARNTRTIRTPNVQPNALPAVIELVLALGRKTPHGLITVLTLGSIEIPQGENLSEAGNVLYVGGVRQGLVLDKAGKDPAVDILGGLRLSLAGFDEPVELKMASTGVHQSKAGNDTVCFMGTAPFSGEGQRPYTVQVYVTHLGEKDGVDRHYNLSVKAFPKPQNVGRSGPQVVGDIKGLMLA